MKEEISKILVNWDMPTRQVAINEIVALLSSKLEEQAKAFGGCKNCYGKGYATQMVQAGGTDEWTGKNYAWEVNPIRPCDCERGKGIQELIKLFTRETPHK